jgi:hypothetical protein
VLTLGKKDQAATSGVSVALAAARTKEKERKDLKGSCL